MSLDAEVGDNDDLDDLVETGTYTVNVYAANARLLREYSLDADTAQVRCLEDAALQARENLESCNFADVVLVVTEETVDDFNQVQIDVGAALADPA